VVKRLAEEEDHKSEYTLLRLFFLLTSPHQVVPADHPARIPHSGSLLGVDVWAPLAYLLQHSRNLRVQEEALRCLGIVLSAEIQDSRTLPAFPAFAPSSPLASHMEEWLRQVETQAGPKCPPSSREAAADSLKASRVLSLLSGDSPTSLSHTASWGPVVLRAWGVALRLMEDDDSEAREAAAAAAGQALPGDQDKGAMHEHEVMSLCFAHLTATFGDLPEYHQLLLATVLGSESSEASSAGGLAALRAREDDVEGEEDEDFLFEKEADNMHGEPLFVAQLAAVQLRCIAARLQKSEETKGVVNAWRANFVAPLKTLVERLRLQGDDGPSVEKSAFLGTSCMLLLLHCLAPKPKEAPKSHASDDSTTVQHVITLLESLASIPQHPLVLKMIHLLRSMYLGSTSSDIDMETLSVSVEDFHPMFLVA